MNRKKSASLQYWVYCILNKNFGTEVKISRGNLYRYYEVNRHDFDIETNTLSIAHVEKVIKDKLISCGYARDPNFSVSYSKDNNHIMIGHVGGYSKSLSMSVSCYD